MLFRSCMLLLDAKAALESAELVAYLLAQEFNEDQTWIDQEIAEFKGMAKHYTLT